MDLARLGIFSLFLAENRGRLLEAYLGRAPDERERAHLSLARGLSPIFYSLVFRWLGLRRGITPASLSAPAPSDLAAVLRRVEVNNISLIDEPSFVSVLTQEALRECSGPGYASALAALR